MISRIESSSLLTFNALLSKKVEKIKLVHFLLSSAGFDVLLFSHQVLKVFNDYKCMLCCASVRCMTKKRKILFGVTNGHVQKLRHLVDVKTSSEGLSHSHKDGD